VHLNNGISHCVCWCLCIPFRAYIGREYFLSFETTWQMCAPADFSAADEFLNDPQTRKLLGVGDRLWVSCAMDVYEDMSSVCVCALCVRKCVCLCKCMCRVGHPPGHHPKHTHTHLPCLVGQPWHSFIHQQQIIYNTHT